MNRKSPLTAISVGDPAYSGRMIRHGIVVQDVRLPDDSGALVSLDRPMTKYLNYPGPHSTEPLPGPHGQQALFDVDHMPPVVESLFATEDARHLVPTALGLAARHSLSNYGELPIPSKDLSKHSAPLVEHLQQRGIVHEDEPSTARNELGFERSRPIVRGMINHFVAVRESPNTRHLAKTYEQGDIADAQSLVRGILRKNTNISSEQFGGIHPDQGKMFE